MHAVPVVSVVTPVYNGERYLQECIESVLAQTYQDWEYVVFDNVSTDHTPEIAESYASRDSRIRLVRATSFAGVHANHNRALRSIDSRSRYCKFVHADDWLYPECLERMVGVADRHPSVGVVSAYRLEDVYLKHDGLLPYTQTVMEGAEVVRRALLGPQWVTGSPTSLLFRADLVREEKEFLDETVWHSDTDAAYRALMRSDLGFVHQVLTFTRLHPGAQTPFSHRVNSYIIETGRMIVRYGPKVLSEHRYRATVRGWLAQYMWYITKQALKPSRYRNSEFRDFHLRGIAYVEAEAQGDRTILGGLALCRTLLRASPRGRRLDALGKRP